MRSSSSERPSSPPWTEEKKRVAASLEPATLVREPQPTLIGVAPAAPIVTGRPDEVPTLVREDALDTIAAPVLAPWRPQDAPTVRRRRAAGAPEAPRGDEPGAHPPVRGPKHTFDAISIGDIPVASRRRGRTAAAVVTVVAAIAIVLIGKRVSGKGEAAPAAPATTAPSGEAAPTAAPGSPAAAGPAAGNNADALSTVDVSAANRRPSAAPGKSRHSKPPPKRKHSVPPKKAN